MTTPTTIHVSKLYDGSRFLDSEYEAGMRRWMDRNMPGFPLGLLSEDVEKWEVQPRIRFVVKEFTCHKWVCPSCLEEILTTDGKPQNCLACVEEWAEDSLTWEHSTESGYAVLDEDQGEWFYDRRAGELDVKDGNKWISLWPDESDAESLARDQNHENAMEDGYGFPWANGWAFMPDRMVADWMLAEAGFRVAEYTPNGDESYRLAGIDGGGYAFDLAHYAPLYAIFCESRNWTVKTVNGDAYVTRDNRTAAEQMAAACLEDK